MYISLSQVYCSYDVISLSQLQDLQDLQLLHWKFYYSRYRGGYDHDKKKGWGVLYMISIPYLWSMRDLNTCFRPLDGCSPLCIGTMYRDYYLSDILSAGGYSAIRLIERSDFGYIRVYFEDAHGICRVHDIHPYNELTQEDVTALRDMGVLSGCDLILRYDGGSEIPKWVSVVDSVTKRIVYPRQAE